MEKEKLIPWGNKEVCIGDQHPNCRKGDSTQQHKIQQLPLSHVRNSISSNTTSSLTPHLTTIPLPSKA